MTDEENKTETVEEGVSEPAPRLTAEIGYFDGVLNKVPFNQGDNIQTLLNKADLNFGDGQSINDGEGNDVEVSALAEDGKEYMICGNYKQGK